MKKIIVALIGMPGSGKGEASKSFKEKGFKIFYMRSVIRNEIKRRGIRFNSENVGRVSNQLRERFGKGIVARRLIPKLKGERICIEGVRSGYELNEFKRQFPRLVVVAVAAPARTRYERAVRRRRADDVKSYQKFLEKDRRERAWGIPQGIRRADYKISNNSDLKTFQSRVNDVVERILKAADI